MHTVSCRQRSRPGGPAHSAHPISANAKVAVAQLDGLLRGNDWVLLVPVVNLHSA